MHQVGNFMSQAILLKNPVKTHPIPSQRTEGDTDCLY